MNNYTQEGRIMTFTAPGGGVTAGNAYQIGQLLVVAMVTAAAGASFAGVAEGVVTLPKDNTQAWTEGALLYWDSGGGEVSTTATGKLLIGCAAAAAAGADTTGSVRLNGIARANEA